MFTYNENINYCDFSDNPLKHIDNFFILRTKNENSEHKYWHPQLRVDLYNVSCIERSPHCYNEKYIFNYTNFVQHIKRKPVETDLSCSIKTSCDGSENELMRRSPDYSPIMFSCDVSVLYFRMYVKKNKTIFHDEHDEKCMKTHKTATLNFYKNHILYIPEKLVEATAFEIQTLKIHFSKLSWVNEIGMRQFGNELKFAQFWYNNIKAIEKSAFQYNERLVSVDLQGNPIKYIDSKLSILRNFPRLDDYNKDEDYNTQLRKISTRDRYRCGHNE